MKKRYILGMGILMIISMVLACKKFNSLGANDPTNNPSYLYGRLFLTDTLTQNILNSPLAGKTITVNYRESTDTVDYLYNTTTDANGYFKFSTLNAGHSYVLRYKENVSGKIMFARSGNLSLPQTQATLTAGIALSGQTGFIISIKDSQGNPVNNADVCLATSIVPYNSGTCDGSQFSLKSDVNGHASSFGVPLGTYYIVSKISINNVSYSGKGIITLKDTNVVRTTLKLAGPAAPSNQLVVYVYDANNNPLNGAQVCLFSSKTLAARDTCEGSNYSSATDPTGKAVISNMNPGKYYILGQLALTKFKLLGKDSITVASGNYNDALHLK